MGCNHRYNAHSRVLSQSSVRDAPDPTPLLLALALAVASAFWFIDNTPARVLIFTVVAAPLAAGIVYSLAKNAYLAMVSLIAASALPRMSLEISSMKARPEHMLAILLCLALPWLWNSEQKKIEWTRADWLLAAYIVVNIVSSWFMSVDAKQTIKWALQQALAVSPYFVLRIVAAREESFKRAFRVLLIVGAVEAAYAVIAVYANLAFGTTFGLSLEQYEGMPAVYGTQYEPNFLGSYCGVCALMMAVMYIRQRKRWYLIGYMISFAGMAVSYSRAALLASVLVLTILLAIGILKEWVDAAMFGRMALATGVITIALAPALFQSYEERFSTINVEDITSDPNTFTRAVQLAIGIEQFLEHPVLGNGTASFQLTFDTSQIGEDDPGAGWLSNFEVRVLHDTGLIGFGVFVAFLVSLGVAVWGALKRGAPPELLALVLGTAVYMITFQATEGTVLAFAWVHLGLIACAAAIYAAPGIVRDAPFSRLKMQLVSRDKRDIE